MDIAAMASAMKFSEFRQSVAVSVAKLVMDQGDTQTRDLVKMMETSVNPSLGSNIDIQI